jgi:hypothetical protein
MVFDLETITRVFLLPQKPHECGFIIVSMCYLDVIACEIVAMFTQSQNVFCCGRNNLIQDRPTPAGPVRWR